MARADKVHFVRSTQARADEVLVVDGRPLWQDSAAIFERLELLCGEGSSNLFAEPNVKEQGNGRVVVAWFSSFDDDAKSMDTLDRAMRSRVEANLGAKLEALRPALDDPAFGETAAAMLNLVDGKSIVAVGDEAVLTSWGMLPEQARSSRAAFAAHSENTVGPFLPRGISPRIPGQTWLIAGSGTAGAAALRQMAAVEPPVSYQQPGTGIVRSPLQRLWVWPLAVLSGLFLVGIVYAAWPGNLLYPEVVVANPPPVALADVGEINSSLEDRIAISEPN